MVEIRLMSIFISCELQRVRYNELQTQMEISVNLYYLNRDEFDKLYELSREIERMLSSLIGKLRSRPVCV